MIVVLRKSGETSRSHHRAYDKQDCAPKRLTVQSMRPARCFARPDTVLDVEIDDPAFAIPTGATPVLIDDIASSASTMVKTVEVLKAGDQATPTCIIVHALFRDDAYQRLRDAGRAAIISTNTVKHLSNIFDVGDVIGAATIEAAKMAARCRANH